MHYITKDFDFCYGHRVWSQALDAELSDNQPCKCRHLHGHQGKITVKMRASSLENGMVTDFHHLNWFKKWLDEFFDHKMILDTHDPLLPTLLEDLWPLPSDDLAGGDGDVAYWVKMQCFSYQAQSFYFPNPAEIEQRAERATGEMLEGLVVVDFVPTSENLSTFFYYHIKDVLDSKKESINQWAALESVTFQETPKTSAHYAA